MFWKKRRYLVEEKKKFKEGEKDNQFDPPTCSGRGGGMVAKKWLDQFSRHFRPFLEEFVDHFLPLPTYQRGRMVWWGDRREEKEEKEKNFLRTDEREGYITGSTRGRRRPKNRSKYRYCLKCSWWKKGRKFEPGPSPPPLPSFGQSLKENIFSFLRDPSQSQDIFSREVILY